MFTRILVLLDGSDLGDWGLPLAAALARRSDARLELVHVREPYSVAHNAPVYDNRLEDEIRARTRTRLENTKERVTEYLGRDALLAVLEGPVTRTLETHIASSGADLVVMATHGRGGLSRLWLGSVADYLARHSTVPMLYVRPQTTGVTWRGEPLLRRIVVPLDGSELAETVLDRAVTLATPGETELALLRIVVPLVAVPRPDIMDGLPFALADLSRRQREAEAYLEHMSAELRASGFAATTKVSANGHIARAILEYAEEVEADLIALSTHGHGGAARLLLGSVADKILRAASMPVLMLRPTPDHIAQVTASVARGSAGTQANVSAQNVESG